MASTAAERVLDIRVQRALAPISDDHPAGSAARGEPDYEAIEAHIRKLETEGPGAVNWKEVASNSVVLLETRSKDVLVATWMTFGLLQTEKLAGFGVGIATLRGLADAFWPIMFPPVARERARVSALEWLSGRATPLLAEIKLEEAQWELAVAIYDDLSELDRLVAEKLTKEQAAIGEMVRTVRGFRDEARRGLAERAKREEEARAAREAQDKAAAEALAVAQAAPPGEGAAAAETPAAVAAAPSASPAPAAGAGAGGVAPVALAVSDDPDIALAQLPEQLRGFAGTVRNRNIFDPRGYLLSRQASWLRIRQLPPAVGGKSAAAAPVTEIAALEAHKAANRHRELIALGEELVWTAPFWFDGHRMVADSLKALSGDGAAAAEAIAGALAGHFRRFEGLSELVFVDGTPFASPVTREWVGAVTAGGGTAKGDLATALLAEARAAMAAGRAPEGLEGLAKARRQAGSGRERILVQIAQAGFCLETGLTAAALSILEDAAETMDRRDIEPWDPDLVCRVAELRFKALSSSDATRLLPEERRRALLDAARARISRIDLTLAARLLRANAG